MKNPLRIRFVNISKKRFFLTKAAAFLLIPFCCYFMTDIMPISPIYFTTLLGICVLFIKPKQIRFPNEEIFIYVSIAAYSISYLILSLFSQSTLHECFVSFFFALYYIFADLALYQISEKKEVKKLVNMYFLFFSIYYIIDLAMRIKTSQSAEVPTWIRANPIYMFYMLKNGGLNGDSNTIGVFALCFFAVMYFSRKYKIIGKRQVGICFLFVVLSCSRAAIASAITLVIFYNFYYKAKLIFKFFIFIFFIFIAAFVYLEFMKDASFLSKIDIFHKTALWIQNSNISDFLHGVGPNNSKTVLGRYAHNIWSITIIEYGFVQLLLFIFMFLFICIDSGKYFFFVMIPYFLVSLSFTPIFLQFLMVDFLLVKHISRIFGDVNKIEKHHSVHSYFLK